MRGDVAVSPVFRCALHLLQADQQHTHTHTTHTHSYNADTHSYNTYTLAQHTPVHVLHDSSLVAGTDFKTLEEASLELAGAAEKLEASELRWLELAELAGDI